MTMSALLSPVMLPHQSLVEEQVIRDADPVMGSDDFAAMLEIKAGCYLWLGNTDPDIHFKGKES